MDVTSKKNLLDLGLQRLFFTITIVYFDILKVFARSEYEVLTIYII